MERGKKEGTKVRSTETVGWTIKSQISTLGKEQVEERIAQGTQCGGQGRESRGAG